MDDDGEKEQSQRKRLKPTYMCQEVQTCPNLLEQYIEQTIQSDVQNQSIEESCKCSICFENWTVENRHRLVALKCGHLFGESCVKRWFKTSKSCPTCKESAKKNDIRKIFVKTICALDRSETDNVLNEVTREKSERMKLEEESGLIKVNFQLAQNELDQLKLRYSLQHAKLLQMKAQRDCLDEIVNEKHQVNEQASSSARYRLESAGFVDIHQNSDSRVLSYSSTTGNLIVTQKSANPIYISYGIRKYNINSLNSSQFICIHQKQIKDARFHPQEDLLLTASLDKMLKIVDTKNSSVIASYTMEVEPWSCCWNPVDSHYFYMGLRTGSVLEFDRRNLRAYPTELISHDNSPIISMHYINKERDQQLQGVFTANLRSCQFHRRIANQFTCHQLPIDGSSYSADYDPQSNHILISRRPFKNTNYVTHMIYRLSAENNDDNNYDPESTLNTDLVSFFKGGPTMPLLLRSKIFADPNNENSSLIVAGDVDEKSNSSCFIWQTNDNRLIQNLPIRSSVFDSIMFDDDQRQKNLALLTPDKLLIYNMKAQ